MAAPFNNIRSKLNRAIVAYLISVEAGTDKDTFPHVTDRPRAYPNTTIRATIMRPDIPMTGNYRGDVHISIKGSASKDPTSTDYAAQRRAFDARLATVFDALMQSDDDQTLRATAKAINAAGRALAASDPTNNADMADFTLQQWYDAGFGDEDSNPEGNNWDEILIFTAVACGSNTD